MSTKNKRAMISLPPEWEKEITTTKKECFYDTSHAEMYRQLIRRGLDAMKKAKADEKAS